MLIPEFGINFHCPVQNRLLRTVMQPVFRLREDGFSVGLESLFVNFLALIRKRAGTSSTESASGFATVASIRRLILITAQNFDSFGGLRLLAHRNPDIGVKHVRTFRGRFQIVCHNNLSACAFQNIHPRLKFFWRGNV